jgi:parvulin-like peptidyl-prolyl isomerase
MNSQTVRRPENKRPPRSQKPKKYNKQTARFEGKRDGKPLIFSWGTHLSHNQKVQIQRRATWITAISVIVLIAAVIVGFWVNINIIIPSQPITSVNGHPVPQSLYRKMVAFKTQLAQISIYGPHGEIAQRDSMKKQLSDLQQQLQTLSNQFDSLKKQVAALKPGSSPERTKLTKQLNDIQTSGTNLETKYTNLNQQYTNLTKTVIPQDQTNVNQSQVGNDSVTWLQNDELIREWLATQSSQVQASVNPSARVLSQAMAAFKANIPKTSSYAAFLSKDSVSDDDMQAMMAVILRRDNLQAYLASQVVSPTYQVQARMMTLDTQQNATKILNELKHGGDFAKLAKASSVDNQTATKGGSLGWLARGQYVQSYTAANVEMWLFDPARKINELSPIIKENGTFRIVQLLAVDHTRAVDAATLQSLKSSALTNWLTEQQALPGTVITPVDQNKLLDAMNMPPDLPLAAPSSGSPGGAPGGIPGGGVPAQP